MNESLVPSQRTHLRTYAILGRLSPLKSYEGKILFTTFIGIHIPLLALLLFFILAASPSLAVALQVLGIALVATLVGAVLTLLVIHWLLAPIRLTYESLRAYLRASQLPDLPTGYTDQAGILMSDTQFTIRKLDEVIHYLASYDQVTGLPNETVLRSLMTSALAHARLGGHSIGVMVLSVDNLKELGNALGQQAAEDLSRELVRRLNACIKDRDVLAHLDGTEFGVMQLHAPTGESIPALAQKFLDTLAYPLSVGERIVHLNVSIGITIFPTDEGSADQLLNNARTALYYAQQAGGGYQFYMPGLSAKLQRRLDIQNELRSALTRGEFTLHYQPQFNLRNNRIIGIEALVRWNHPTYGFISPGEFIPIAEESGLILTLGEWVLNTACQQNAAWQTAGLPPVRVAVNLSARQLRQPDLIELIDRALKTSGLAPRWLELEVTESLMMENPEQTHRVLEQIHARGIALSLDDFGTGYSSLGYLHRFPLSTLKIDRSFVQELGAPESKPEIIATIIALGQRLGLELIAEGVETQAQREYLEQHSCFTMQGYLFSRPLPADQLKALLTFPPTPPGAVLAPEPPFPSQEAEMSRERT